jgi:hypothetical protein
LACLLLAGPPLAGASGGQAGGQLVPALEVLARAADASTEEVLEAIRTLVRLDTPTSGGTSLLLDRANIRFEADPRIRTEALAALAHCCPERDLENRMVALRVVRVATAGIEPDPRVRAAALAALSRFQCAEARDRILESALEAHEPDASVRKVARGIITRAPNS